MTTPLHTIQKSVVLHTLSTTYNDVSVVQSGDRIDMEVTGATFATWHPTRYLTGYSWDALAAGCCLYRAAAPPQILVLGLAGGTLVRQVRCLIPKARITAVEIDPELVELGREYMELDRLQCEVIVDDAYQFLQETRRTFSIIIDDVYRTGPNDVERPLDRADLLTRLWQRPLAPDGMVLANFIIDPPHDQLYRASRRSLRDGFPSCASLHPPQGYNTILAAGDDLAPTRALRARGTVFTDKNDAKYWKAIRIKRISG